MDDLAYGRRDERGDWKPLALIEYPQVFVWPVRPRALLKWLFGFPGYLLPWDVFYGLLAVLFWLYLTPDLETMRAFRPGWIAWILARNLAATLLFFGGFHLLLYVRKAQGTAFKYNGRWPATDSSAFLFGNQTVDNMIWTLGSGVPIWTAYEVVTLWAFANGYIPFVSWTDHPLYCGALMFLIPLIREVHFYCIHRFIHWRPLYRGVHRLHHNNVNPGPWSGLSMHPVEHLLYFSNVLIHWILPSHPVHGLFTMVHLGLSPAPGHVGFDKIVVGKERALAMPGYAHYLHHKLFECNYADGSIPLDRWFGSFHDGSDAAQEAMTARRLARHAAQRA